MKCKNCGATLDEGALFCRKCGTAVPKEPATAKKRFRLPKIDLSGLLKNRRLLAAIGLGLLLLIVLIVVIASVASCKKPVRGDSPEQVCSAVVDALQRGDGETLRNMAKTSEPFLGQHPEVFGEGETAEDVMRGYYDRMADDVHGALVEQFGKKAVIDARYETETLDGSAIFEENSVLAVDAEAYAVSTGALFVGNAEQNRIRIVTALLDGEWKLIVVYLY